MPLSTIFQLYRVVLFFEDDVLSEELNSAIVKSVHQAKAMFKHSTVLIQNPLTWPLTFMSWYLRLNKM